MKDLRTKQLLSNTVWFALGNFGTKILTFFLVPFYTSILLPEEYGKIDIISTTIQLILPLFSLSISDAIFRYSMDKNEDTSEIFSSGMAISIVSPLCLFFLYPVFKEVLPIVTDYWWLFFGIYTMQSISNGIQMFLQAVEKTKIYAVQGIIYTLLFSLLNILLLAVAKIGIIGYLISEISSYAIVIFYMFFAGKLYEVFKLPKVKITAMKKMVRYSLPLIPASLAWFVMTSIDKYMLLHYYGESANGLYAVAHKIPTVISTITMFFIKAWQISAVKTKDDQDSAEFYMFIYKKLCLVSFSMSFIVILLTKIAAKILFAKDFFASWTMVPCLIVATLFSTICLFEGAQFTAYRKTYLHLTSNVIAMVSNCVLNYIFMRCFGPVGAAFGTMLSYVIMHIYRYFSVMRIMNIKDKMIKPAVSILLIVSAGFIAASNIRFWYLYVAGLFLIYIILHLPEYKKLVAGLFVKQKSRKR